MVKKEIVIIGGGASGLMAAGRYANRDIAILESNTKIAQKIMISGGGKCNITNKKISFKNYLGDNTFISKILNHYTQHDLLNDLKHDGLVPVLRKESQYFCPKSASELIDVLYKRCKNIPIFTDHKVLDIQKKNNFIIQTNRGIFEAKKLIIASGGLSYPKIGASDIAFKVAQNFGHEVRVLKPALVGLTVQKEQFWMKELSGISLLVRLKVDKKEIQGDLLFTHKGISGPAILNTSLYWEKGQIEIDFLPDKNFDKQFFSSKKNITSSLGLPKRFVKAFLFSIGLQDQPLYKLNHEQKERLRLLKMYSFAPAGNFGYTKAEVTRGGICTDEIDSETMMSKKFEDLYFLGECLDVTGELGGYNFQWAFSTAQRLTL